MIRTKPLGLWVLALGVGFGCAQSVVGDGDGTNGLAGGPDASVLADAGGADAGLPSTVITEDATSTSASSADAGAPSDDAGAADSGDIGTDAGGGSQDAGGGQGSGSDAGGTGGGTDSGGGSSGTVPTTCAGADQDYGCCANGTLYYCTAANTVTKKKCSTGLVCGWSAANGYYDCVTPPSTEDPSGSFPIACQ